MRKLSDKPGRILGFIRRFVEEKGYPPSIRDIQAGCGISSTSVVDYNLRILEREGRLRRDREVSRGIELAAEREGRRVRVPLVGYIAAGEPLPIPPTDAWASEELESLEVPPEMVSGRDQVYALKVKGTSMIDALINDGDIVLMQPASSADEGEMVAVWLKGEGETTLKRFYRGRKRVRLQPANARMKPLYAKPENVEVQGRVVGVIRQLG